MKKALLIFLFLSFHLHIFGQGITFFKGNWEELILKSKQENKAIFIDFYTEWCGPCKRLDKEFFQNNDIKIGNDFLFYKLDAEKGEGITIAERFKIDSYPTGIFLAQNNEVFYRTNGFRSTEVSLFEFEKAKSLYIDFEQKLGLEASEKKYLAGNLDSAFVLDLVRRKARNKQEYSKIFDGFWTRLSDNTRNSMNGEKLLIEFPLSVDSQAFNDFEKLCKKQYLLKIDRQLRLHWRNSIKYSIRKATIEKDSILFERSLLAEVSLYDFEHPSFYPNSTLEVHIKARDFSEKTKNDMIDTHRYSYYLASKDSIKFMALAERVLAPILSKSVKEILDDNEKENIDFIEKNKKITAMMEGLKKNTKTKEAFQKSGINIDELTKTSILKDLMVESYFDFLFNYAKGVYQLKNDKMALSNAIRWLDKSQLLRSPVYSLFSLKSKLLYKMGMIADAIKTQKVAVKMSDNDTDEVEILNKMKKRQF